MNLEIRWLKKAILLSVSDVLAWEIENVYIDVERNAQHPLEHPANMTINTLNSAVYGGDDGARTRDLCRDRSTFAGN
jgi:hypothetical protein